MMRDERGRQLVVGIIAAASLAVGLGQLWKTARDAAVERERAAEQTSNYEYSRRFDSLRAIARVDSLEARAHATTATAADSLALDFEWMRRQLAVADTALHRRVVAARLDSADGWLKNAPGRRADFVAARNHLAYLYEPLTARQRERRDRLKTAADQQAAAQAAALAHRARADRVAYARELEARMRASGDEAFLHVEGPDGTTLRMYWSDVTPWLDADSRLSRESLVAGALRAHGFTRLILTNAFGQTRAFGL